MTVLIEALAGTTERGFEGKGVKYSEFFPHDHTRSCFLLLLNIEGTILVAEMLTYFTKHKWEHPLLEPFLLLHVITTVHEHILGP